MGQIVAAAGNEHALHAEFNWIPVNLCAAVPRGVAPEHAAFSTVGAIAMHGVRRAEVQLGETACVIGLGLVGQLVVRLLIAAGVRVIGIDVIEERCRLAEQAGAVRCAPPTDEGMAAIQASLDELSSGRGADHVFLAAGGSSNAPVETAARLARDRARVVDIGKTSLDLPWSAYYDKELDVRLSRSYGPGRYDDRYELEGIDYPAGYVRWTERRNLECFLDLVARKEIEVETLVSGVFPLEDAQSVYADLASGSLKAVGVLLQYPAPPADSPAKAATSMVRAVPATTSRGAQRRPPGHRVHRCGQLRVGHPAAAPGRDPGRQPVACRDHQVAVRGQCPAAVRLRDGFDPCRRRARGRVPRRDLHRDPAPHPRQPRLPCPADGQGGLRGEASRHHRRGGRPDRRGRRRDGQRPADGGLQPALRAAVHRDEIAVRSPDLEGGDPLPG